MNSISMKVHFKPGRCGHKVLQKGKRPHYAKYTRLPRICRLMALSIKYERLLQSGTVVNHRTLAQLAGVSESQISAILCLRLLAPDIQEWLLNLPEHDQGRDPLPWKAIHPLTTLTDWEEQRKRLSDLISPTDLPTLRTSKNEAQHKNKTNKQRKK